MEAIRKELQKGVFMDDKAFTGADPFSSDEMNKDLNEIDTFAEEEREAIAAPMKASEMIKTLNADVKGVKPAK